MIGLTYDNATQLSDLTRDGKNLVTDEGLETAVLLSLFTRRRALDSDELPDPGGGDQGGWWGDRYSEVEGDLLGSRLWLLARSKSSQDVVNRARVYSEEALQWMVDDGMAKSVEVETERQGDRLAFKVSIQKPNELLSRWVATWAVHLAEL